MEPPPDMSTWPLAHYHLVAGNGDGLGRGHFGPECRLTGVGLVGDGPDIVAERLRSVPIWMTPYRSGAFPAATVVGLPLPR